MKTKSDDLGTRRINKLETSKTLDHQQEKLAKTTSYITEVTQKVGKERADSEAKGGLKLKSSRLFASMASNGPSGCRSCCENSEVDNKFDLAASVDFAQHTPHMLVCESPGHCREKEQNQTVEDSIRKATSLKKKTSAKSE